MSATNFMEIAIRRQKRNANATAGGFHQIFVKRLAVGRASWNVGKVCTMVAGRQCTPV